MDNTSEDPIICKVTSLGCWLPMAASSGLQAPIRLPSDQIHDADRWDLLQGYIL